MRSKLFTAFLFLVTILSLTTGQVLANQNVLLIIADDLGVDVLNIEHVKNKVKVTTERDSTGAQQAFYLPNISTLLANGVYFTNAWAAPVCSPTRATIYTGMQPWRTGVGYAVINDVLEDTLPDGTPVNTIANAICDGTTTRACALFGKWHLGGEDNPVGDIDKTPLDRGWDYYAGNLGSHLPGDTYENWPKYTLGSTKDRYIVELESTYATKDVVDEAKAWIDAQTGPWFATLAFNAPHSPFHVPPDPTTYQPATLIDPEPNVDNNFDKKRKYNAMIQALDYYVGKLWDSNYGSDISDKLRNTLIIFLVYY